MDKNADRWANSAIKAAEAAMKRKVRVQSNKGLGAYEHYFSDNPTPENDPVWPADCRSTRCSASRSQSLVGSSTATITKSSVSAGRILSDD